MILFTKIGFKSQLTFYGIHLYIVHHQSKTYSLSQISNTLIPSILLIKQKKKASIYYLYSP